MATQNLTSAPKSHIDAGKFLGSINKKGFGGQIRLVENKLKRLSEESDSKLRLVAHFGTSIYFEDTNTNKYYQADLKKNNRTLHFENITELVIEDNDKAKVFDEACVKLVDCIEEGDESKAQSVFNKIAMGYCTSSVVPENGRVKTWDGNIHNISISESAIPSELRPAVVDALKEAVNSSDVVIKEGTISVGDEKVELPISETTRRLAVARNMRMVAEGACGSDNFGRLVKTTASHVSNNNMRDAVSILKSFLTEEQEFTTLDKDGMYSLVESTLYRQGIFNYHAIRNTATLMWETNCHLNKKDIIKEWSTAASKCGNKQLSENVEILKDAAQKAPTVFSDALDKFIKSIFNEDHSTRTIKARSYLNMLKMLNNVVSGSDADQAVKGTVDDLVMRLESDLNNVDDATLFEVEDLLATVSTDLIHDTSTLADFDTVPEPFQADQFGTDEDALGDFEGDMGGGFGPEMGGDIGGGAEAEADAAIDDAEAAEGDTEEEEELDLQLDSVMQKAKPVSEMEEADIQVVVEALKGIKPETVEVDGEFRKMLKKGLTEDQVDFIRNVMKHSKTVNEDLFGALTALYYDLVISEGKTEEKSDTYEFGGNGEVEINEDYTGIEEKKDPAPNKGGKDEAGLKGAEERGDEAAGLDDGVEEDIEKGNTVEEGNLKNLEGDEEGDRDGDFDDNEQVDESIAVVSADNDEQLLDMIDKVLGSQDGDDDDEGDDDANDNDYDDDENVIAEPGVDGDSEFSDEADPDQDGNPVWDDEDDQAMKEDNNITDPAGGEYDSEANADKHGDGSKINPKPNFSDKDYDGTKGATTGKDKPSSGHPNTSK